MADDITHQQLLDKIDISHEQLIGAIDTSHQQLLDAMTEQLGVITDNMVTKRDLKEELKAFATKDDLERMTIRLERKIDSNQKVNITHHLATRYEIGGLNQQFGNLREGLAQAARPI